MVLHKVKGGGKGTAILERRRETRHRCPHRGSRLCRWFRLCRRSLRLCPRGLSLRVPMNHQLAEHVAWRQVFVLTLRLVPRKQIEPKLFHLEKVQTPTPPRNHDGLLHRHIPAWSQPPFLSQAAQLRPRTWPEVCSIELTTKWIQAPFAVPSHSHAACIAKP